MGKSGMRPTWTCKLEQNIISIEQDEKDLGVVVEDNLSPEEHILDQIFSDTFWMVRNIRMAFLFLSKDMMRKNHN